MKVAALDFGSNTFLLLIAEVDNGKITKIHHDGVEIVRLGQELEKNKKFHTDALARAENCMARFSEIIAQHQPERTLAMATSAARDAENKEDLFKLATKFKIPLEIIPGEKEAEITYRGSISGIDAAMRNILVVDIGGGSTEFIFGEGERLVAGQSFNIGCVRLTERFFSAQPTDRAEVDKVIEHIDTQIKSGNFFARKPDEILAVAGTPTTLAAVELGAFDPKQIDGFVFTKLVLEQWLEKIRSASFSEKVKMGIPEGRADVILVGVITLLRTLVLFNMEQLTVSTRGVRYGVALELASRRTH